MEKYCIHVFYDTDYDCYDELNIMCKANQTKSMLSEFPLQKNTLL